MKLGISSEFSDLFDQKWIELIFSESDIDFFQLNVTEEMLRDDYIQLLKPLIKTGKKIRFLTRLC